MVVRVQDNACKILGTEMGASWVLENDGSLCPCMVAMGWSPQERTRGWQEGSVSGGLPVINADSGFFCIPFLAQY